VGFDGTESVSEREVSFGIGNMWYVVEVQLMRQS
jgi:hypothetical protein